MPWPRRGSTRVSYVPFILLVFSRARPLTPQCGTELEKEASKAAEALWVKVQRLKEKAEGESHKPLPLFDLFFFHA